jgi:glycosyltransferase involved in cell wall biosynthesis
MLVTFARCRQLTPDLHSEYAIAAPGRLEQELAALGADVHPLGDVRLSRPASVVQARARLSRLLMAKREQPAIVVCHAPWAYALFAPIARRRGVPVVFWQHNHTSGRSIVERWARRTPADLVICNSTWTSTSTRAIQPEAPIAVVHPPVLLPPVPNGTRLRLRASLQAGEDVVMLAASRIEPGKGHLALIRAVGQLADVPGWSLWIAGAAQRPHEQTYLDEINAEIARLHLASRVRWLGERTDVPLLMAAADVFCQANTSPDAFGIVFAEGLLSGLPVVTPDMGGAPEIVSQTCGRLVPPDDADALAGALRALVQDAGLRRRLGANGPAHAAARVSPEIVLPRLARTLESLGPAKAGHYVRLSHGHSSS